MKTLVLYDSAYGNTARIARSIGGAVGGAVEVLHIGDHSPSLFEGVDFLLIGSPTQGGRPTKAMLGFLTDLPSSVLVGTSTAAFDTRLSGRMVGLFGNAAEKIASILESRGAAIVSPPAGFIVKGKEGPLKQGEVERAALWAKGATSARSSASAFAGVSAGGRPRST